MEKIQTDQEIAYNNLVSQTDFKKEKHIYATYNDSIKAYKRYRKAFEAGCLGDACEELSNAAHKLAAVVEWSVKNLVWNYYKRQMMMNPSDSRYTEWERTIRFKKLVQGRERNMTTHDLFDLVRSVYATEISGIQISAMDDENIRKSLINGYKHTGTFPDVSAYLETNAEIYQFLEIMLIKETNVELLSITNDYPNSWEELLISCSYFKPGRGRHFVLIADSISDISVVQNLFKIDWDMILDFSWNDSNSDRCSLYDQYLKLQDRKSVILKYLCDIKNSDILPSSSQAYWIKINGRENAVNEKEKILEDKKLAQNYIGNKMHELLKIFSSEYTMPVEIIMMGCSAYPYSTNRLMLCLDDHYKNTDELTVHIMNCNNNFLINSIRQGMWFSNPDIFKVYDLSEQQLSQAIGNNIGEYNEIMSEIVQIPHTDMTKGNINFNEYLAMKSVFELVYMGIEKETVSESIEHRGGAFLRGDIQADWDIVANNDYCIFQNCEQSIREEIIRRLKNRERGIYTIDYEAGLGGTTFMRKMSFLLHEAYPTIIVTRYVENTVISYLLEIYKNSLKEMVLLIDSNNLSFSEVVKLHEELVQKTEFSFEIVFISRKEWKNAASRHLSRLNYEQCLQMQTNLSRYISNEICKNKLAQCVERAKADPLDDEHIPFVLSMYAFDEKFNGITDYVKHSMESLSNENLDIVFVLALADFANYKVDSQYFVSRYGRTTVQLMKRDDFALAPLIKCVYDNTKKKESFQIRYSLFTTQILKTFSGKNTVSFTALLDRIIDLIENSRRDEYSEDNEEIIKLFNKLFIEREDKQQDDVETKGIYSPLITRLISENRLSNENNYDGSENAVVKIFKSLVDTYPEQPHFAGHLARYYFYNASIDGRSLGFDVIDEAINTASKIEGYAIGSLYHIKAMGYVSRINAYRRRISEAIYHYNKMDGDSSDIQTILDNLGNIRADLVLANKFFDEARKEENSRFVSNIAECNLIISIQTIFSKLKEFCADNSIESFIPESEVIELYDRTDSLIEDSEILLIGEKSTKNKYNASLLEKIKQSVDLAEAYGEEVREVCKQIISSGQPEMVRIARRKLARIEYRDISECLDNSESQETLLEIVLMMERNFDDDSSSNADFRIWFKALRSININDADVINELEDTIFKLDKWTSKPNVPADAFYYKYIVKFLLAFEEGTLEGNATVREDLQLMLLDLKKASEKMPKRSIPFEWFSCYHKGLRRLISSTELNDMGNEVALSRLYLFRGELPSKESFRTKQAYISFRQMPVYFNPQSICDRITENSENQYVDFGLGFSYTGLRSYHDSIKIHKGHFMNRETITLKEGLPVVVEVVGFNNSYVMTTIRESGGKRCDLKYEQLEPLGYSKDEKPRLHKMFDVVLDNIITLKNGIEVWHATINYSSSDKKICNSVYRPFENISDLLNE